MTERKGTLMIEPQLLLKSAQFVILYFGEHEDQGEPKASDDLTYSEFVDVDLDNLHHQLSDPDKTPSIKMSSVRAAQLHSEMNEALNGTDLADQHDLPHGMVVIALWKTPDNPAVFVNLSDSIFQGEFNVSFARLRCEMEYTELPKETG